MSSSLRGGRILPRDRRFARAARFLFGALVLLVCLPSLPVGGCLQAAEGDEQPAEIKVPLGKFITVNSPVNDAVYGLVSNTALTLQNQAVQEKRPCFLILEITNGSSPFHQVQGLAKLLTSSRLSRVTTVAWIPKTVTGNNVVVALACKEIIMHPDAELGDIGLGKAVDLDERDAVVNLVEKRRNTKLSRALVLGMMDPQQAVMKIKLTVESGGKPIQESRVVTPDELNQLRDNNAIILDVQTIKEAGTVGSFSGSKARALDILAVHTAQDRVDITDLYQLPRESMRSERAYDDVQKVALIRLDGVIEPVLETFLERQIERAQQQKIKLIIFEIESPGGYLLSSLNLANSIAALSKHEIRTVAYVPKMAHSGAAIVALGCDEIYLRPDAQIGDAGPIEIGEGGQFERAPEKVLSALRESLRALAEQKNRPPAVAMAMADKSLQVFEVTNRETGRTWYMSDEELHQSQDEWVKGPPVPEAGEDLLLTLNGRRAHDLRIAEPPVADLNELKGRLGIAADEELKAIGRTWIDTLVIVLNSGFAMFLLLVAGSVLLYLELHTLTGLFGILSAVCFSLFFWSRFLGGTAGWLEVVLFGLGVLCMALEVFVIPGFGVFGISGVLLMLVSMVMASQTFGDFGYRSDLEQMTRSLSTITAAMAVVVVLSLLMSRFLPELPFFRHIALIPPGELDDQAEPQLRPEYLGHEAPLSRLIGEPGATLAVLRPSGKARVGGRLVDVVSDGPFVAAGATIEVVSVTGNRIVVRTAHTQADQKPTV